MLQQITTVSNHVISANASNSNTEELNIKRMDSETKNAINNLTGSSITQEEANALRDLLKS